VTANSGGKGTQVTFSPVADTFGGAIYSNSTSRESTPAMGRLELLPASLQEAIALAEEATREHSHFCLNLAVGYGGRQEITDTVSQLLRDRARDGVSLTRVAEEITPEDIGKDLYTYDLPRPGPYHPNQPRAAPLGLSPLAERL